MAESTGLRGNSKLPIHPLRLLRLKEGEQATIWITHFVDGSRIKGLFTRHLDSQSQIISQEEAQERVKGRPGVWKGYISACEWKKDEKRWVPVVVEVTERSEQDFRGKIQRGQIWKLSKAPKEKNKKSPLRAAYLEARPEAETPPALDVLPKLRNDIFRQAFVALVYDNPLPDLVFVAAVEAAAPGERTEERPIGPEKVDRVKFSERMLDGIGKQGNVNGFSADGRRVNR